jgi:MFS transporter, AAHS family, benzoate transport protein
MRQIDLYAVADNTRFDRFHALILFWCTLIIILDGYDLAIVGISLPSIMKDMGVTAATAGFMVSLAFFGMAVGVILIGSIADRIGRRWAIAVCVLLFGVFSAASGLVSDPVMFAARRFLAGLGLGGIAPNVAAQTTEYSPRKRRSIFVTLSFSGYAIGGMIAALTGKGLLVRYGWQSVFLAALPVILLPWNTRALPESLAFLHRAGRTLPFAISSAE